MKISWLLHTELSKRSPKSGRFFSKYSCEAISDLIGIYALGLPDSKYTQLYYVEERQNQGLVWAAWGISVVTGPTFHRNQAPSYTLHRGQIYGFRRSVLYHVLFKSISFLFLLVLLLCYDHFVVAHITRKAIGLNVSVSFSGRAGHTARVFTSNMQCGGQDSPTCCCSFRPRLNIHMDT